MTKLFYNSNRKIRALQICNHIFLIWFLAVYGITPHQLAISLLVYYFLFLFGINVGAHRYFTHRAFRTWRPVEYLLGYAMTLCTAGSTLAWVGMHRKHHTYSDKPLDPHSPREMDGSLTFKKFLKAYIGFWDEYIADVKSVRDLRKDPLHRGLHKFYFLLIFVHVGLLAVIGGLPAVVFGYVAPAVLCFHGLSMIVAWGHCAPHADAATHDYSINSLLIHWFCAGEGLHNEHHRHPKVAYFREAPPRFFDFPGFLIQYVLRRPEAQRALRDSN